MATAPISTPPARTSRYPALQHRNFRLIWSGLLVSNMGTWMQSVAQSWIIYKLTGNNSLYLGWLGLSFALPMVLVPPLGGAVVDRVDRVKLLYVTQTASLLLAMLLAVLTWLGLIAPAHLLAASFLEALLLAFDNPARQSLIPELVPRHALLNALSLNSSTFTGAALIGPALAGVLLDIIGAGWLFLLNALSYLAVLGALWSMHDLPVRTVRAASLAEALLGGIRHALRDRLILFLLELSALGAVFGRSYQQLLPVFADDIWRVGSGGYGALLAAGGAGALIGAFAMASVRAIEAQGRLLVTSGLLFCALLAAFALAPNIALGVALLLLVGVAATVFSTLIATMLQLRVPGELRGRVMSLYSVTLIGMPSLGGLGVAALAHSLSASAPSAGLAALLSLLGALGVSQATAQLGPAAGAPRAIVLGVLVLALILVLVARSLVRVRVAHGLEHR